MMKRSWDSNYSTRAKLLLTARKEPVSRESSEVPSYDMLQIQLPNVEEISSLR